MRGRNYGRGGSKHIYSKLTSNRIILFFYPLVYAQGKKNKNKKKKRKSIIAGSSSFLFR